MRVSGLPYLQVWHRCGQPSRAQSCHLWGRHQSSKAPASVSKAGRRVPLHPAWVCCCVLCSGAACGLGTKPTTGR